MGRQSCWRNHFLLCTTFRLRESDMPNPTVFIVDDDPDSRRAAVALVGEMGLKTEAYSSAEDFLAGYNRRRPACLITDVRMLGMSGLELQEYLNRDGQNLAVIVLTAYANTTTTIRAIKNGAVTLLEKPCDDEKLWDAIRAAIAQDIKNLEVDERRIGIQDRMNTLSNGEREVLAHMVAGEANKVIANKLGVSIRTVEVRRHNVFEKMEADSLAELLRLVLEFELMN